MAVSDPSEGTIEGPGGPWRYRAARHLAPGEARTVEAALARFLATLSTTPAPWAVHGRGDAYGYGAAEIRDASPTAWADAARRPFAVRAADPRHGPGDVK